MPKEGCFYGTVPGESNELEATGTSTSTSSYRPWVVTTIVGDINFVCRWQGCDAEFFDIFQLQSHIDSAHFGCLHNAILDFPIRCPISGCDCDFPDIDGLLRHISMHIFQARAQFVGYRHMLSNEDVKHLKTCSFEYCQVLYDGSPLSCSWRHCGVSFDEVCGLFSHVRMHVDLLDASDRDTDSMHVCLWDECEYRTKNKADLRRHLEHHSGEKVIACPFCSRFFSRVENFTIHLKRNQKSAPNPLLQCQLCMKQCSDQAVLCAHVRRHFATKQCDLCGFAASGPAMLNRHYQNVHTQKSRIFECPDETCGKTFYSQYDLICHQSIHEEPRFKCETCGAKFRWKKVYEKHIIQHQANAITHPYVCHLCPKTYSYGNSLSYHLKENHTCPVPEGFTRFQFKKCSDGLYRLQTRKILHESLKKAE